jgi:thiosulfate/3-mercaptopyruvate sulfurtransferase
MAFWGAAALPCYSGACGLDNNNWEDTAKAFMNSDVPSVGTNILGTSGSSFRVLSPDGASKEDTSKDSSIEPLNEFARDSKANAPEAAKSSKFDYNRPPLRSDLFVRGQVLEPLLSVSSSDLVLDVSNGDRYPRNHARDALHLPSDIFLRENGSLKSVDDMAEILGHVGVVGNDPFVVYGDSMEEAALVFWVLRYLGSDSAKVMDGTFDDWIQASLPLVSGDNPRKPSEYVPRVRQDLLASYNYVSSGDPQIVDSRSFQEFGKGRIPGSIFVPPEQIMDKGLLMDPSGLNQSFSTLDKSRSVVVCCADLASGSLVWYALQLMGFDSRLYPWSDWMSHSQASKVLS